MKAYLGDSVYIDVTPDGALQLTTENGVSTSNTIVLDVDVYTKLIEYADRHMLSKIAGFR